MMRVFAVTTGKSVPVMGSLVLLLLAMLWPFQSALAQERRVVAMETEVRGIVFRIPRAHLHIRDGDGSFDLGLRVDDLTPRVRASSRSLWPRTVGKLQCPRAFQLLSLADRRACS